MFLKINIWTAPFQFWQDLFSEIVILFHIFRTICDTDPYNQVKFRFFYALSLCAQGFSSEINSLLAFWQTGFRPFSFLFLKWVHHKNQREYLTTHRDVYMLKSCVLPSRRKQIKKFRSKGHQLRNSEEKTMVLKKKM